MSKNTSRSPARKSSRRPRSARPTVPELEALQEHAASLERITNALLHAPQQAFYVFDHQKGKFLMGNAEVSRLYGYKLGEVDRRKGGWIGLIHPQDLGPFQKMHDRMMKARGDNVHEMRMRVLRKDGGHEWVHVYQRILERDDKGAVKTEAGLVRVITEQVRSETELQDSREGWHSLFQHNTAGVLIFNCDFRIRDANPMICKMLKYDRKTLLRLDVHTLIAPGSRAAIEKVFARMQEGGKAPASFETRLEGQDGTQLDVLAAATCRRDDKNACHECMMIFTDLTAHKEAERALKRESEINRVLIDHAPVAIGLISPDARLLRMNRAAEKLFGFNASDVVGKNVWDIPVMTSEEMLASQARFQRLLRGEDHVEAIIPMRTKTGEIRFVESATTAVRSSGHIDHFVTTGTDVTERKRLEAEVIRVAEQEHIRIGADLHDGVGQTLTGVGSLMEVLVQGLAGQTRKDGERVLELLKTAQEEMRRLSHGLSPAAVRNRGLAGGLKLIADTIRLNFRRECDCAVNESLKLNNPEAETHLFRIAQEAVNNALRHGGARKIWLSLRSHDKHTGILEITDDGSGFPVKKKAESNANVGIGLRVMEYRANLIGGRLKINVRSGRGVRVTCHFPTSLLRDQNLTIL